MKKNKIFLLAVLVFMGSVVMTGFPGEAKKVKLQYFMWDPGEQSQHEEIIKRYQKDHPDVEITIESAAWGPYWDKITTLAASKRLPDVFSMSAATIKDWASRNTLVDLQAYIDRDINPDDYYNGIWDGVRYPDTKGNMYAFPYSWSETITYYNKDALDELGLSYPENGWSWDDLLSYAKKLTRDTNSDGEIDQWGYYTFGRYACFDPFVVGNRGKIISDDFKYFVLDEPKAKRAAQFLVDLVAKHKVSPITAMVSGIKEPFGIGLVAMHTEGNWKIDTYRQVVGDKFDWGIVMTPIGPDANGKQINYGWPNSYSISAFSSYKEEAWEFIKFITGSGRQWDEYLGGEIPSYRANAECDAWLEADKKPANKQLVLEAGKYVRDVTFPPRWTEWRPILQSGLEGAFRGLSTLDEVLADVESKIENILARKD
jgi:multiple sugar transport system substrate-binding protein